MVWVIGLALGACGGDSGQRDAGAVDPEVAVTISRPIRLTDVARIPEYDPNFDHAEVTADGVILFYRAKPAQTLEVGHVIVGTGDSPFLRTVTRVVSATDTRVELETDHAELVQLIADGAFTIRVHPKSETWLVNQPSTVSGTAFKTSLDVFAFNVDAFKCTPAVGNAAPVDFDPYLEPDFSYVLSADITPAVTPPFGELQSAEFSLTGQVVVGAQVWVDTQVQMSCVLDLIAYLREQRGGNFLRFKRPITTALGPVPVELTLFIDPIFKFEAAASGNIDVSVNGSATLSAQVGLAYADGQWTNIWEPDSTGSINATLGQTGEDIRASGKVSAGISFGGLLYDTAGPTLGLSAFLQDQVELDTGMCTYRATASLGAEAELGLKIQVPVIAKEIATISKTIPLASRTLDMVEGSLPYCADAGVADAGAADASVPDASVLDASSTDASLYDAFIADASLYDAGPLPAPSLYWRFENDVTDSSGHGLDGTGTDVTFAAGQVGQAASFNGVSSVITNAGLTKSLPMTISLWVNYPAIQLARGQLVAHGIGPASYTGWRFLLNEEGALTAILYQGIGNATSVPLTPFIPTSTWTHLFVVYDTNSISYYVNGILQSSGSYTLPIVYGTNPLEVGARSGVEYYQGLMDELAIWHQALDATAAQEAYDRGIAATPLI